MRIYLVSKIELFWYNRERYSGYHYAIYHGLRVFRSEKDRITESITSPVIEPMHMVMSWRHPPKLFDHGPLVVHRDIMEELKGFRNIRFVPVVFDKIVDVGWNEEITPKDGFGNTLDAHDILWNAPADEERTRQWQGTYYELVCWMQNRILDKYTDWQEYNELQVGPNPFRDKFTGRVSPSMMAEYPIVSTISGVCSGFFIVREDMFRILDPYLNRKYFLVHDLSGPPATPQVESPPEPPKKPVRKWSETQVEKVIKWHVEHILQAIRENLDGKYDAEAAFADEDFSDIPSDYDTQEVKDAIWDNVTDRVRMLCEKSANLWQRFRLHVRRLPEALAVPGVMFPPEDELPATYYNRLMFEETTKIRQEKGLDDPNLEPDVKVDMKIEKEAMRVVHSRLEDDWRKKTECVKNQQQAEFPAFDVLLQDFYQQIEDIHKIDEE